MDNKHRPQVNAFYFFFVFKAMFEMRFFEENFGPQTWFHICGGDLANRKGEDKSTFQSWTYSFFG